MADDYYDVELADGANVRGWIEAMRERWAAWDDDDDFVRLTLGDSSEILNMGMLIGLVIAIGHTPHSPTGGWKVGHVRWLMDYVEDHIHGGP